MNTFLLVTGGTVSKEIFEAVLLEYSFHKIIAADKGLEACHKMQIMPDVVIGDFDSADFSLVQNYKKCCEYIKLPTHKDYTDTHVALQYAVAHDCDCIVILGGTGTRMDHTWANIGLLKLCTDYGIQGYIIDANNRISMINQSTVLYKNNRYPYVSLIPYSQQVSGVTLTGFEYSGENLTFSFGESLGISNSIQSEQGSINMQKGYLLVIESKD